MCCFTLQHVQQSEVNKYRMTVWSALLPVCNGWTAETMLHRNLKDIACEAQYWLLTSQTQQRWFAAVSLLGNTTEKVRAVNQVRDPARKRCVLLSTCPPELLSCFFSPRFSFSNERRSRYTSAHSPCPLHALFTASLEVGVIVMGAASWIIKHIFSTIGCDLAKWMWMRAFPSYLYYLTRNGWRMDGRDRGARAAASSHIHSHHSQSVSVSLLLHNFFYLVFPSLLHSRCLPFSITSYSFLHSPSLYLCLSLPEDFYLISLLTEM